MRLRQEKTARRGATIVETAIVLIVFFILVFGMIDLGVGVYRYNIVSQAARQGARQAIVHGSMAVPAMGQWGTAKIDSPASATSVPIVTGVQPYLVKMDLDQTRIIAEWLDGSNEPGKRVRVTVTSSYQPRVTFIFGNPTFNLQAASTLLISH